MSSRQAILGRIRSSLRADGSKIDSRLEAVRRRIDKHPAGVVPKGPDKDAAVLKHFVAQAEKAAASVTVVRREKAGIAIAEWLRDHNLPQRLRTGEDKRLKAVNWPKKGGPEMLEGASDGSDLVGLSHAAGGVAETGTLLVLSGPDNPTTLNFLPENHIVMVEAGDITQNYEAMWSKLRRKFGKGNLPRTVNMITGPSRSADIEQTLILGAHGPVRLHIVVVRD